jgi:arginine utilization protein RocB
MAKCLRMSNHPFYPRVEALTRWLVNIPSVTNTPGEAACARAIAAHLGQLPYFRRHPDHLRLISTVNDRLDRQNVFALVRGGGRAAVGLAGHFDTVGTAGYGQLEPWATDPGQLLPRLQAELAASPGADAALCLADLNSGEWMPGRGALDMKSGLAAGIAVLERWAAEGMRGNLLLIATPDEEDNSHGMRSAAGLLPTLLAEWELDLQAVINLDATVDQGDGREGRRVFLGSTGKLLPFVFAAGCEAHVSRPFDGVNPNLVIAEVIRRVEYGADLCDTAYGETAAPPVSLKMSDFKAVYDVTTPSAAWAYFNLLTLSRSPAAVLEQFTAIAHEAVGSAVAQLRRQAEAHPAATARGGPLLVREPTVLTFAALREKAGAAGRAALERLIPRLQADPTVDPRVFSGAVTEALWQASGLQGPGAVVGYGSLYYPPVHLDEESAGGSRIAAVVRSRAAARGVGIGHFFPGIADMSWLGGADSADDLAAVEANSPFLGVLAHFDYPAARRLQVPTLNAGPWGRDYHQRTERVHMPYAFETLPRLLWDICCDVAEE